jgi:DNA-binding LytR/AlgR family response regulator
MIIAANISLQLSKLGYEVSGIVPRGEEAIIHIRENQPDIVLLDINLKGELDGIETAKLMQQEFNIPIIYLTANADDAHFNRAKETKPAAFISKPFKKLDLQRAIELTVSRIIEKQENKNNPVENPDAPFILNDRIFVKYQENMVKIFINDIYYIEADRNYCRIFSKDKEYLLVMTLKDMNEKLPANHFLRIHRSYIVNVSHVDEVGSSHVEVSGKTIPLNKSSRQELLKRIQTI